jgi:two-component system, NarL family, nitrate/nitrite response regulator NarL
MKILSADDHSVFRQGLKTIVETFDSSAELLEAESFTVALQILQENGGVDLVLLDLMMPGMDAFDGLVAMRDAAPNTPIVIVSMIESRKDVLRAIELGAHGFIPKAADPDEMVNALRAVMDGQVYLPPALLLKSDESRGVKPTAQASRVSAEERLSVLTGRQREVAELLGQGLTNAQIAEHLELSESTVRLHVSTILDKLDLSNRTQVALLAAQIADPDIDGGFVNVG